MTGGPRWRLDQGWVVGARRVESPNCSPRPVGAAVDLLVVHGISLPPGRFGGDAVERLFGNRQGEDDPRWLADLRDLRVSAHFLIDRAGGLTQFVPVDRQAWHAGVSQFAGRSGCNAFSVGVELEGCDFTPYAAAQYAALARLSEALFAALPLRAIRGHAQIAPGRKTDPGPCFDWQRLRELSAIDPAAFPAAAR